jgi:hypothetical protein
MVAECHDQLLEVSILRLYGLPKSRVWNPVSNETTSRVPTPKDSHFMELYNGSSESFRICETVSRTPSDSPEA